MANEHPHPRSEAPRLRLRPRYYRLYTDPGVELAEANYRHAELDWQLPLREAALICLDCWNDHFSRDTLERIETISRDVIAPLLAACREHGLQVIHAPAWPVAQKHPNWLRLMEDRQPQPPWPDSPDWPPAPFREKTGEFAQFARPVEPQEEQRIRMRSEQRDFHPAVRPVGDEAVIHHGEELHRLCAQRGILHLFYVGFNTNACIVERDYGIRDMMGRGYHGILVRDATTGMETHETLPDMTCTRGQIASLEQFGAYTIAATELVEALANQH